MTNETFPWKKTQTNWEDMQNILTVMKYEPNLYQTVICHLHVPRWFPSTPFPTKLLNFLGTTPQARPLKNQLWCYTWRHWTAEAPDPPNMKEMSFGSFLASVLIFPLCLHSKQKITCQVPRKLLEAEIKNNLITRLRVHPWSSTAHPRKVIIPKRKKLVSQASLFQWQTGKPLGFPVRTDRFGSAETCLISSRVGFGKGMEP